MENLSGDTATGIDPSGSKEIWIFDEFSNNLDELLEETRRLNRKNREKPPQYDELKTKLLNNPYYFCSWADEVVLNLDLEQLRSFFMKLFENNIPKPRYGRDLVDEGNCRLSVKEVAVSFFVEAYVRTTAGLVGKRGVRSFSSIANLCNEGGKKFGHHKVRQGFLEPEYLPAIEYLHKWGRLHITLRKGSVPKDYDSADYDAEGEFKKLPNKSKALLEATKCVFWSAMRTIHKDARALSMKALRQVMKLDPRDYEWNYQFANWARLQRRTHDRLACISEEEMNTLWETYDKCEYKDTKDDQTLRGMAFFGVLQGIAELLKFRSFQRITDAPFMFGELVLENDEAARTYVLTGIKSHFEESEAFHFAGLIRAGEILSSLMPKDHRDYLAAEKYFRMAWRRMPTNSKINHKLGTLYATSDEVRDISKALPHLRLAYDAEKENISGAIDFIQTLLISPAEHAAEAENVLEQLLNSSFLQQNTKAQVLMLKGALKFMTGNNDEALNLWILHERCNLRSEMDLFSSLRSSMKRFRWAEPIDFSSVHGAIDNRLKLGGVDDDEKRVLEKLRIGAFTASNRQPYRQRATTGTERQEFRRHNANSESDRDDNWRSARETSNSHDEPSNVSVQNSTYQPPARRFQHTYSSNNNAQQNFSNSFPNSSRGRNQRYSSQASMTKRFPSPTNWRK